MIKKYITKIYNFLYVIFRIIIGCFFTILCPQNCNNTICTFSQNFFQNNLLHIIAISSNILTFLYIVHLHIIEYKRENFIKKYITHNYNSIDIQLNNNFNAQYKLNKFNKKYYDTTRSALSSFILNFILSIISLYFFNIYFYTFISLFAFGLLLFNKIYKSYKISMISYKNNKYYSAYKQYYKKYNIIFEDFVNYNYINIPGSHIDNPA